MKDNFMPGRNDDIKALLTVDDDKMLRATHTLRDVPPDEDDGIARNTVHCACFAGSGMPVQIAFQKTGMGLFDCVVKLFQELFNAPGPNNLPDLSKDDEGGSKYTLAGQRAELPIIKQLHEQTEDKDDMLPWEIETIYRVGLALNRKNPALRDSSDAIAIIKRGDERLLATVEVKGRVTPRTFHAQRNKLDDPWVYQWNNLLKNESKLIEYEVYFNDSGEVVAPKEYQNQIKSSEILQCLHHSAVYNTCHGILLIGDKRDLIAAIILKYPSELIFAYQRICRYLLDEFLHPFYAEKPAGVDEDQNPELPREVYDALKSERLKHLKISNDAFDCFFGLWYYTE